MHDVVIAVKSIISSSSDVFFVFASLGRDTNDVKTDTLIDGSDR